MRKIISVFIALIMFLCSVPIMSYAGSNNQKAVYTENSDDVYFADSFAQIGKQIKVEVKNGNGEYLYKWYIDKKEIANSGNTYIPTESDIESMLTAEVYRADGELIGTTNMLISKLPVMYIEIENREKPEQKETRLKAHMKLQGNAEFCNSENLYDGEMEIKGRGNSTWLADKKPYKIKLDSKTDLLGMGKNKHWVLLSNPYDESLSRNKLIYDLAADMGLDAMSSQWVDVVMNGEIVGNYLLCEHVRIGDTRVNITDWDEIAEDTAKAIYKANKKMMTKEERDELSENLEKDLSWVTTGEITYKNVKYKVSDYYDLPSINGGYLLEGFLNESPSFQSKGGKFVSVSKPEGISKDMLTEIGNYYSAFETATKTADFCTEYNGQKVRYSDLADVESFAKYALINEIFQNQDFPSQSTYMYKDVDGKLIFGPVWDMDNTSDNSASNYSHYKWTGITRGNILGVVKDPVFMNEFYKAYRKYRYTAIEDMLKPGGDIDVTFKRLYESGLNDDKIWQKDVSFEDSLENFRMWLSRRLDWIDSQMTSFETFYASVNGYGLNNSKETELKFNDSVLEINSSAKDIAYFQVSVNGIEKQKINFKSDIKITLDDVPDESVISAIGYDSEGNCTEISSVTNYNEPIKLIITKTPQKKTYSAGEKIDLDGLELKAVFADKSEKTVDLESVASYVGDCMGAQSLAYGYITDKIGKTYISLRYRGVKVDYSVERVANDNAEKVEDLIDALPQSNLLDSLEAIFNAKMRYDALDETEKAAVTNIARLNGIIDTLNEISETGDSPILGCYIDGLSRYNQRNRIVIVAKGNPNKLRIFNGGNVTTFPVSNRTYCISEKKIGDFSLITVVYALYGNELQIGAYYNHVLKGELYSFDVHRAYENCNRMITSCSYDRMLSSKDDTERLNLQVVDRVKKVRAEGDGVNITVNVKNNSAKLNIKFGTAGEKTLKISYYCDGEWYEYKSIGVLVRVPSVGKGLLAIQASSESVYDEEKVFVATSTDIKTVNLLSGTEILNLSNELKNGFSIWSCTVKMDTDKKYSVFVDSENTGKNISIKKIEKLLIEDNTLVKCRVDYGEVDIPKNVCKISVGAFDGFHGTVNCYKNSPAQKYAESNGINFVNYGFKLDLPNILTMNIGEKREIKPVADPIFAPEFSFTVSSSDESVVSVMSNTIQALKPGYARVKIQSNDGLIDLETKIFIGGGCTKGDVNGDGKINSLDALLILQDTVGTRKLDADSFGAADIDNDGKVNSSDALNVLKISTGESSIWDFV